MLDDSERIALNSIDVQLRQHELFEICKAAKLVLLLNAGASPELFFGLQKRLRISLPCKANFLRYCIPKLGVDGGDGKIVSRFAEKPGQVPFRYDPDSK